MGTENARFFSVRPGVPCLFEPRLVKMGKRKEFGDVLDGLFGKTPPIYSDDLAALLNAASIDDAMRNAAFLNGKSRCILEVSRDGNGLFCPNAFDIPCSFDGFVEFVLEGDDLVVALRFVSNTIVAGCLCVRWWSFSGEDFESDTVLFSRDKAGDYVARVHNGARSSLLIVVTDIGG